MFLKTLAGRPRPVATRPPRFPSFAVPPLAFAAALVLATSAAASTIQAPSLSAGIPVTITDRSGVERAAEPVTFGFPIAEAEALKNAAELVVLDADGNVVPAQFRVLQRWRAAADAVDEEVRWVLVDFQADVPPLATAVYRVKRGAPSPVPPAQPLVLADDGAGGVTVDAGSGQFHVAATMNLLDRFAADFDADGAITAAEDVIRAPKKAGFVLRDRFGAEYGSANHPSTVTVEEAGPLRAVVRVDGAHGPVKATKGIGRDFFTYRTRLEFYAGKSAVRVQHSLRNAYLDAPLGSIGFEGYRLQTTLRMKKKPRATIGLAGGDEILVKGKAALAQDSDGGDQWQLGPGTSFRGYRVLRKKKVVAEGNQAPGWLHIADATKGLTLVMRDFFENYPKGFEFDGKKKLTFHLFPASFDDWFWLDDGQQKTTDFLLAAHRADAESPAAVAARFRDPLRAHVDANYVRATRAWGDQGHLDVPPQPLATLVAYDEGVLDAMFDGAFAHSSYAFGWSEFGEQIWAKNTHTTGSPRNRLTYFDKWMIAGSPAAFRHSELFALHSRDLRTYHIDGFTKEARPSAVLWEGLPPWSKSPDKLGRDALDPAFAPHRDGIPATGHGWNGFDLEHMLVDDLYEYWLLTGDPVCHDALREIGECMRTWLVFDPNKPPGTSRGIGWALRALVKIHQATGDPRFRQAADALVVAAANHQGDAPSPVNGLVYRYLTRYPPNGSHIADAEFDCPWQMCAAIHGLLLHHRETGSPTSLHVALNTADYVVDYGWNGVAMNESLSVDDHTHAKVSAKNDGVNTWVPSALALCYRYSAKAKYLNVANAMVASVPSLLNWNSYSGWGIYHWWHEYRSLVLGH